MLVLGLEADGGSKCGPGEITVAEIYDGILMEFGCCSQLNTNLSKILDGWTRDVIVGS